MYMDEIKRKLRLTINAEVYMYYEHKHSASVTLVLTSALYSIRHCTTSSRPQVQAK